MNGSVRVGKDGSWYYVFDGGRHPNGKRRQIRRTGFPTKREAAESMRARMAVVEVESAQKADSSLLGVWLREVWLPEHQQTLKRTTAEGYWSILGIHIEPDPISRVPMADLERETINGFLLRLAGKDGRHGGGRLAPRTRKNIYRMLRAALRDAVARGHVAEDCLKGIKEPRVEKMPTEVWTNREIVTFLNHTKVHSPEWHPLYVLAIATGMRRGELAGLQWKYVDLVRGTIRVEQTRLAAEGGWIVETPKTDSSRRTIQLDVRGVSALQAVADYQRRQQDLLGSAWTETGYVFTGPTGLPPHPRQITARFQKACQASGVLPIRLHDIRHTFASNALQHGVNPREVSAILGHSDIKTTLDIYAQFLPGSHGDAMAQINSILFAGLTEA